MAVSRIIFFKTCSYLALMFDVENYAAAGAVTVLRMAAAFTDNSPMFCTPISSRMA
jgi:hypothetical protein